MTDFFTFLFGFFQDLFDLLSFEIEFFGVTVPFISLVGACILIGFCVSIFWKGAKG